MRTFPIFAVLFFVVPLLEIYFLVKVGEQIGALWTIFFVVLTAVIGAFLLKQQGLSTFMRFQKGMANGQVPAQEIIEGFMLLLGGILLMTPGFFTDAVGFLCLIPFTRMAIARTISKRSTIHARAESAATYGREHQTGDNVLDGEYVRKDDDRLDKG